MVIAIGTLVIERIDALQQLPQIIYVAGVAAIGIAAHGIRRGHEPFVRDGLTLRRHPVSTFFDIVPLTDRNLVEFHHVRTDMGLRSLLTDEIATTGHAVLERNGQDLHTTVMINNCMLRGINRIEFHLKAQIVCEEGYLTVEDRSQFLRAIDMQRRRTSYESESGNHPNQPETVVTMQMGNKHMTQFGKAYLTTPQLHLRTLRTVEHEHLASHLDHLRRGVMTKGGKRTSTP